MELLEDILQLLDHNLIEQQIDSKIDDAILKFQVQEFDRLTHETFNTIMSALVHHLYINGFPFTRNLSPSKAIEEAIWLTDTFYRGECTAGYDGAFYDARDANKYGINFVIMNIVEGIKLSEREKYRLWVIATHIDPLDWNLKLNLSRVILNRFSCWLPQDLLKLPPAQLANQLDSLILLITSADQAMHTALTS